MEHVFYLLLDHSNQCRVEEELTKFVRFLAYVFLTHVACGTIPIVAFVAFKSAENTVEFILDEKQKYRD